MSNIPDLEGEVLSLVWTVAAEVTPSRLDDVFVPNCLFFPVAHANAHEWAADFGLQEFESSGLETPADWMTREEAAGVFEIGTYPVEPDGMRYWSQATPERFFVTLEVNEREFALVRQAAGLARRCGLGHMIGEC
jgi:hypothetical protein